MNNSNLDRREFVHGALCSAALAAAPAAVLAATAKETDKRAVLAQIPTMHAANLKRLQDWIALPSIAAENRNFPQVAQHMAQLAKHGFADLEVNMSGGYDPTETDPGSKLIQAQLATYRKLGLEPQLWPRSAGSWPGCVFTGQPLQLPAGHFGLGHGAGAHAPDEYYLIESSNPRIRGLDGAVASFVEYLYALG